MALRKIDSQRCPKSSSDISQDIEVNPGILGPEYVPRDLGERSQRHDSFKDLLQTEYSSRVELFDM